MITVNSAPLQLLNTMGIPATAGKLLTLESEQDVESSPIFDSRHDFILGGGSNVVFITDVPGNVLMNRIRGRRIISEDPDYALVETGAGENWHQLVRWSLDQGLSGLENLSLIPGLAGAAPVQNIGAYGVELSSVLHSVRAWDVQEQRWLVFNREQCHLAYRDSLFKSVEPDRYLITSLTLRLSRHFKPAVKYAGLREELHDVSGAELTAHDVSAAVIRLRTRKLPDPDRQGNAGSFFKNPMISEQRAESLRSRFSSLPVWPQAASQSKVSAAWMIEQCELKGVRVGDAAVSNQHALVLVNQGQASGSDISELASLVQSRVFERFGIQLEPEPRLVQFAH